MINIKSYFNINTLNKLFLVILIGLTTFLLLFRLGTITNGLSINELIYLNSHSSISNIFHNITYLPYSIIHQLFFSINTSSIFIDRLVSLFCSFHLSIFFINFLGINLAIILLFLVL